MCVDVQYELRVSRSCISVVLDKKINVIFPQLLLRKDIYEGCLFQFYKKRQPFFLNQKLITRNNASLQYHNTASQFHLFPLFPFFHNSIIPSFHYSPLPSSNIPLFPLSPLVHFSTLRLLLSSRMTLKCILMQHMCQYVGHMCQTFVHCMLYIYC